MLSKTLILKYLIVLQLSYTISAEKRMLYLPLAVMTGILLVASVTVVPALDAFADHDHGNQKSKDKHGDCIKKNGKYKKNCTPPGHSHHGHHDHHND